MTTSFEEQSGDGLAGTPAYIYALPLSDSSRHNYAAMCASIGMVYILRLSVRNVGGCEIWQKRRAGPNQVSQGMSKLDGQDAQESLLSDSSTHQAKTRYLTFAPGNTMLHRALFPEYRALR